MSEIVTCRDQQELDAAVARAESTVRDGESIVLPTDTVYGIGCDAFSAPGVQSLLGAKGRTREMPPPVLIARPEVMDALADGISDDARALAQAFWPGALTIVCWAQPSLGWDLGETHGTVALRVPDDRVARAVLERVGPMAVSSANRTGMPAAQTAEQAREMLQDRVGLYLDDGRRPVHEPAAGVRDAASTIVDCTGEAPVVLRHGAITLGRLRDVVPAVRGDQEDAAGEDAVQGSSTHAAPGGPSEEQEAPGQDQQQNAAATPPSPEAGDGLGEGTAAAAAAATQTAGAEADGIQDEDLVVAMVRETGSTLSGPVDQRRDRTAEPEPRWGGTSALSMEDARRLVAGDE